MNCNFKICKLNDFVNINVQVCKLQHPIFLRLKKKKNKKTYNLIHLMRISMYLDLLALEIELIKKEKKKITLSLHLYMT